jgi:hypothetical protein
MKKFLPYYAKLSKLAKGSSFVFLKQRQLLIILTLLLFSNSKAIAQFSANWAFTSDNAATVSGASNANVTATNATYSFGASGNLFTNATAPTTNTGSLVGTGISSGGSSSSSSNSLFNGVGIVSPFLEFKIAPNAGFSMTTSSFNFNVEQTTNVSNIVVSAGYSVDGGVNFIGLAAPTTSGAFTAPSASASPIGSNFGNSSTSPANCNGTFTFTVPTATIAAASSLILRVVIWRYSNSGSSTANLKISSPTITGTTPVSVTPVISTPVPNTLTGFTYIEGSGPSPSQSFTVAGSNLTGNITATAPTNYEVSLDNVSFSNSAIVTQSSGTASGTIHTRLKSGLAAGTYNSETIVLSSPSATSQNVTCSGGVSALYYYNGSGALADVNSWGLNTDGSGTIPANFTTNYQTYIIRNTTTISTAALWTVSGTGSKIILGDASLAAVALTIEAGFGITGTLDIAAASSGSNTLIVKHTAVPTFGILNSTSTIDIQAAVTFTGTQTFSNNVFVSNGGILSLSNASNGNVYTFGGNFSITGTGGITTTNIASAATSAALTLTGIGKNITNTASANNFSKLNFNINGTYSLASDFNYETSAAISRTLTIGASGSLNINGKKLTLNNTNTILITPGGTFTTSGTGSTVEYTATQTLPIGVNYNNLIISGAFTKTLSGSTNVNGTLSILGGSSVDTGSFPLTVNSTFTLSENSTITLGSGSHNVTFANSEAASWTAAKTLTITGWTGTAGATGTAGKIFFGSTASGLTAPQLSQIVFTGFAGTPVLLSTGELVPPVTLPVSLTTFTGKKQNTGILLNWSTASESNNQRFDILRSGADKYFQKIGEVTGNVNATTANYYSFIDKNPFSGVNYYTLKQVDFDGKSQEYGPIAVTSDLNNHSLEIYSNSNQSEITVFVSSTTANPIEINVYDLSGRSMLKQTVSLQSGFNKLSLEASKLSKGVFLLKITSDEGTLVKKFIY